ncbi:MAG: glycosyltransferase family 4 protein [Chromatiales bacterium]|jgi:UDP-N-acetylmuramyl pentapeptide phosphotransferase/UDP-N-acetylglucosamine-1-phosphate transferase|nr:glycosyltransferase family 4 protein [Chromatiales bacterium]
MGSVFVVSTAIFLIAVALCFGLAHPRSPIFLADVPNERSLHQSITPRGGGIGVLVATVAGLAIAGFAGVAVTHFGAILAGAGLVAVVSLVDDWRGLPAIARGVTHLLAAISIVLWSVYPTQWSVPGVSFDMPVWVAAPVAVLAVTWMTNLYNFMDGMDGFAAGMGLIGFGTLALLGSDVGVWHFSALCLGLAAGSGGFLVVNFPPARLFLGDVGATTSGFIAGAMICWADVYRVFPWWVGVMVFSPFIVDASVTLIRRAFARERIWEAHRSHFYQRLVGLGWSHRRTVVYAYALMIYSAALALIANTAPPWVQWVMVSLLAVTYTAIMVLITVIDGRRSDAS